ncbi:MAG: hypothetical protein R3D43_15180 [Tepidamorphaceae bacterium]
MPDLERLAGIGQLSLPLHTDYWRGWHGYNVPACETGYTVTGGSLAGDDSGTRIEGVAPKWSFGREYQIDHTASEIDLTAIGVWIPEVPESDLWAEADYLWTDADFLWANSAAEARAAAIAQAIAPLAVWMRFADSGDNTIGYRRARALPVREVAANGTYKVGAQHWLHDPETPSAILIFSQTGWGDGDGEDCAAVSLIVGAAAEGVPPGRLWLEPGQLAGGEEITTAALSIEFGLTVRETVLFLKRF